MVEKRVLTAYWQNALSRPAISGYKVKYVV